MSDDRLSDQATGLPPLSEPDPADTVMLLAYDVSVGLVANPNVSSDGVPVRYLHVRGIANTGPDGSIEYVQVHVAVPVEAALDVAAALAKGTTDDLGRADG